VSGHKSPLLNPDIVLNSVSEAILVIDNDKRIVKVNKLASELLSQDAERIIGRRCEEVVNCYACQNNCPFERVMRNGVVERQFDIEMRGTGERIRQICLTTHPLRDSNGLIRGVVENIRDVGHIHKLINELDTLNNKLLEEKNKIKAILDSIPDGVYTINENWRITSINKTAQKITGYSEEEAIGNYCYKVLNSNVCQRDCPLKTTLETGKSLKDVEAEIVDREGNPKKLLMSTGVFHDPTNKVTGGVVSIRDLGGLKSLVEKIPQKESKDKLVGSTPKMMKVFNIMDMVKDSDSTVLFTGESGTGKTRLAYELHMRSQRRDFPFVKISCAALSENLLESELFGHVRGAFTGAIKDKPGKFETADGGTVFLDEIGEVPLSTQVKLLRFLQEQEFERVGSNKTIRVNVRIIAATNRDLLEMVKDEQFREDLYYRLAVIPIHVPPLRDRLPDLPAFVAYILERLAMKMGGGMKYLSPDVMKLFMHYEWPGNIRELENVLEHGYVCSAGKIITTDALPEYLEKVEVGGRPVKDVRPMNGYDIDEKNRILIALKNNGWKIVATAQSLGIDRTTLWRKMKKYSIDSGNRKS